MKSIFLAASMRSGSTHIVNSLQRVGYKKASIHIGHPDYVNEDSRIDPIAAASLFPVPGLIYQHHIRAIGTTIPILEQYHDQVAVVVTYRNILDSVVSWKESYERDSEAGKKRHSSYSSLHCPVWTDLDDPYRWIILNVVPWYFSFYLSWKEANLDCLFVGYDDYFSDECKGINRILEYAEAPRSVEDFEMDAICGIYDGKFNIGKSGRGESLRPTYKQLIRAQAYSWGASIGAHLEQELICRKL